jgi:molecular chaperone DnaJ
VLTVRERGKQSEHGGLNGDLHITISIKPETGWKRKGIDLSATLKLPYSTALLGGKVDVPLPTGKTVQVQVPARTNTGKKIRLTGQGLFDAANDKRGDILLSVSIVLPASRRKLTPEMEALLRQIDGVEP